MRKYKHLDINLTADEKTIIDTAAKIKYSPTTTLARIILLEQCKKIIRNEKRKNDF